MFILFKDCIYFNKIGILNLKGCKHKSEDYKISAVNNDVSLDDVCKIFYCSIQS